MLLQSTESILNNIWECSSMINFLITRSFDISFKNNRFILKFGCPPPERRGCVLGTGMSVVPIYSSLSWILMTRICDRAHHPEKNVKKISRCPWFKLWTSVGGGEDKLDKAACTVVKGIASRDEYLFEGPKCQNSAFWLGGGCWWFSQFLTVFL